MGVNNRWRMGSNEDGLRDRVVECVMIECVYGIVSNPITDNE